LSRRGEDQRRVIVGAFRAAREEFVMRSKTLWSIVALIAVLGLTATAGAATRGLITGKQIAPHQITSKHLINHTIQAHDLSNGLIRSLHGANGATGPAGPAGPAGPQGAPGLSGHAIATAVYHLDPGYETTVKVTAPAGKVVLGGGVSSATSGALIVEESYPSSATTWTVTVAAYTNSPATDFTVYAIVGTVS
jgi:hypothetical protein